MSSEHTTSFINGEFIAAAPEDEDLDVLNPSTTERITTVKISSPEVVDRAVAAARAAQDRWRRLPQTERARYMIAIADEMQRRHEDFVVDLMTEQGKVRAHAEGEVGKAIGYFRYMAEWARRIEGEVIPSDRPGELIVLQRRPIGVVAGICPWNYPLFLLSRKVAPALITGSTLVIKPAEDTPINALMFAEVCAAVGLPAGVFNLVLGTGAVGAAMSGHPGVDFVTFTGSTATGAKIMESASKSVTKVSLELGGKAPAIVLKDADLDLAVEKIAESRLLNNGQVCTCAERVYVERPVADEFIKRIGERLGRLKTGDPADPTVDVGPLVNRKAADRTRKVLDEALAAGATLVAGGGRVDSPGYFFPPAVIRVDDPAADILYNEVFGPILPVHVVENVDEAIERANDCEYGLASSLYTNDLNMTLRVIDELQFGEVYVNRENEEAIQGFHAGIKASGIGGADGKHAIEEYTTTQVSYIQRH
ncbi:aldehyde dehydrogenase [Tsukamurella pulmonis]|uniref:Lactaldehyde dehydrogenase n=1 Tax=Tsukamurella pulmonis TaxID=47312 RepID=A0A1H1DW35_9ACTN|nr:aldehyde dehydrogenase [Tsukamurella pulmonis]KXO92198.1 aldehyde dehydrogenase [Tsukamurella pulmonis]SDQ80136.1 lactaldehyde dehydrogenase [Tsukamurella pulmonis]SUP21665.1 Lactaldehyde dehydrogenase [Tsukamurella pulmonis]